MAGSQGQVTTTHCQAGATGCGGGRGCVDLMWFSGPCSSLDLHTQTPWGHPGETMPGRWDRSHGAGEWQPGEAVTLTGIDIV